MAVRAPTLWLTLPLDATRLEQPTADLDSPLQGARLLVVDDNDTCRKVLMQQCSAWGMQVSAVPSGKEALALLRTKAHLREYFDAVLLDQDMPGMTGMQLAAKIKEDPSLNHDILLIMLTGISHAPSKVIARNAGIKRILAKPVAGYTLKTTLADELAQRRNDAPAQASTDAGEHAAERAERLPHPGGRGRQHLHQGDPRHARQAQPQAGHRQQRRGSPQRDEGAALRPGADGLRDAGARWFLRYRTAACLGKGRSARAHRWWR